MIRNLFEKIKNWWQEKVTVDKKYLFVLGVIVASFFCITLGMEACVVPTIFIGFIIMLLEWGSEKPDPDWWKMGAVVLGGFLILIFRILAV